MGIYSDWDRHRDRADFVDEISAYLVDVEGDADYSRSRQFDGKLEERGSAPPACGPG